MLSRVCVFCAIAFVPVAMGDVVAPSRAFVGVVEDVPVEGLPGLPRPGEFGMEFLQGPWERPACPDDGEFPVPDGGGGGDPSTNVVPLPGTAALAAAGLGLLALRRRR